MGRPLAMRHALYALRLLEGLRSGRGSGSRLDHRHLAVASSGHAVRSAHLVLALGEKRSFRAQGRGCFTSAWLWLPLANKCQHLLLALGLEGLVYLVLSPRNFEIMPESWVHKGGCCIMACPTALPCWGVGACALAHSFRGDQAPASRFLQHGRLPSHHHWPRASVLGENRLWA